MGNEVKWKWKKESKVEDRDSGLSKTKQPEQKQREDEPTQERNNDNHIEEVDPEEIQTEKMMWLDEKVSTLEKENQELKKNLEVMTTKVTLHENAFIEMANRFSVMENAITQIAERVEGQNTFNESMKTTMTLLVEEVKTHHGNFQEVAWVLQNHHQFIAKNGTASEEMAGNIRELIRDNEKKSMRRHPDERSTRTGTGPSAASNRTTSHH